jgi:hypothetical protein
MIKTLFWVIILLAPLLTASTAPDAIISWTLPTTFTIGTPIPPAHVKKIVVEVYSAPTKEGPWRFVAIASPGATSAIVPGPPAGDTLWYTVAATLDGAESGYAVPVSKTNYSNPIVPIIKKIAKKVLKRKKVLFLFSLPFMFLLIFLVGWIRYRQRKRKK